MYNLILTTNILRILREKKLTKAELAQKAGVSISFFTELTNDKANPSLRIIEAIAKALDTPLPLLFDSSDMSAAERAILTDSTGQLAKGFVWKGAILSEFQAYQVAQWDRENRELLKNLK
jgi:transcriptional regulator with XRE-family HTH domain